VGEQPSTSVFSRVIGPHFPTGHDSPAQDNFDTNPRCPVSPQPHFMQRFSLNSPHSLDWQMANLAATSSSVQRGAPSPTCRMADVAKLVARWRKPGISGGGVADCFARIISK